MKNQLKISTEKVKPLGLTRFCANARRFSLCLLDMDVGRNIENIRYIGVEKMIRECEKVIRSSRKLIGEYKRNVRNRRRVYNKW